MTVIDTGGTMLTVERAEPSGPAVAYLVVRSRDGTSFRLWLAETDLRALSEACKVEARELRRRADRRS